MRILPHDQPILDALEARGAATVERAIDWCAVNSGSRNLEGLRRMAEMLTAVLRAFPGATEVIALNPSPAVAEMTSMANTTA